MNVRPDPRLMTDRDVADLLRVCVKTLQRRLKTGPRPGEPDMRKAEPMLFGGGRLWLRADVEKVIGL